MAGSRKGRASSSSSSKKIIVYAIIGIVAVAAVSVSMLARSQPSTTDPQKESRNRAIEQFQTRFCGDGGQPDSTQYTSELVLPSECEMPLAVEVDGETVWYVSTKHGTLGSYSLAGSGFEKEYAIPSWPARSSPTAFSMSWAAKADDRGNIWFTDERQNAIWRFNKSTETFDAFRVPANLPASMDFDSQGNIYFVGVQSKSLFFGNVSEMKNGTSDGITEIPLPLDGFSGIDKDLITSGSLVIDDTNNDVWVSILAFQQKGQLFRYDIDAGQVDRTVDLPADITSPVGMALDNSGSLWVTDHGTNVFFRYDPASGEITKFVTSVASPRIYGGTAPSNAYTLPYWIERAPDGSLWFNEHTGNKIARFDPQELTLVEYWIPSQNRLWALCPDDAKNCGVANALQLSVGPDNQVWFTEWTENKMGTVDADKQLPFSVDATEEITVARGDSAEIRVTVNASGDFNGRMIAAGTFTPNAGLGNSSGIFSEESVSVGAGSSKQVSYTFTAAEDLAAGQYIIMIGAGNDDVSYTKAVRVNIV